MPKRAKKSPFPRLRVKYTEADRVRSLLLSEDIQTLKKRDVQTLLKILDDVYPPVQNFKTLRRWRPLLIGIGVGLFLVFVLVVVF